MSDTKDLNLLEAVNEALDQMMALDKSVVGWGQDCGYEGGVFRVTSNIQQKHGEERFFDAPIAEATIVGTAIGAALAGLRPVVEIQFQGFSFPIFQQLMCHGARFRNRTRGSFTVPMVVRMPMGGGINALEHHSEAIEALFAHIPGLKVVMPATAIDAKGLLVSAIKDNDPVIFLEPKSIYRSFREKVPTKLYETPIGKAKVVVEGEDITVVTFGACLHIVLKALKKLVQAGKEISVEVIDLRTISPLDSDTIIESVKKTGRLLVVQEAVKSFSVASEIITRVNEEAFDYLEEPPQRLTGFDITVPLAKGEKLHRPDEDKFIYYLETKFTGLLD